MRVAICTRDNPVALAAVLGAIKALIPTAILLLDDASASPIITMPSMARLLAGFRLFEYNHRSHGNLPAQRLSLARKVGEEAALFIDDDVLLHTVPSPWATTEHALFGFKVDLFNDRGYADFSRTSETLTPHSYPREMTLGPHPVVCAAVEHADCGLVYAVGDRMADALYAALDLTADPWVADNLAARFLTFHPTLGSKFLLYPTLAGDHMGNSNAWWGPRNSTLVDELYKKAKHSWKTASS